MYFSVSLNTWRDGIKTLRFMLEAKQRLSLAKNKGARYMTYANLRVG